MKSLRQIVEGLLDKNYGEDDTVLVGYVLQQLLHMDTMPSYQHKNDTVIIDAVSMSKRMLEFESLIPLIKLGIKNIEFVINKDGIVKIYDCDLKDMSIKCDGTLHFYGDDLDHAFTNMNIQCRHLIHGGVAFWTSLKYNKCKVDCKTMSLPRPIKFSVANNCKMNVEQLFLLNTSSSFNKMVQDLGVTCYGSRSHAEWTYYLSNCGTERLTDVDVLSVLGLNRRCWPKLIEVTMNSYDVDRYGVSFFDARETNLLSTSGSYVIIYKDNWKMRALYDANNEMVYSSPMTAFV